MGEPAHQSGIKDVDLIHELFYEHDIEAILKVEIPKKESEDRVAWHHEPNGIFSVKSAYRLALSLKHANRDDSSCSTQRDGDRKIWNCIWKSNVPPKVRIFGWRVATDTLPTKMNKSRRNLEWNARCDVCGNGTEDTHHATVTCTKAATLRHAMRECWKLPDEKLFWYSGKDWL
jgi:hypothetical protein